MPLPAKMKVPEIEFDPLEIKLYLLMSKSTCEISDCQIQAVGYHRSAWSFVFLCEGHDAAVKLMHKSARAAWERKVAEDTYERMLEMSFVHQNHKTDFELQALVNERERFEKELDRIQSRQRARDVRDMRKGINESEISIGAPDELLLTARQRQFTRAQADKPLLGKPRQDKAKILRPRLIVSLNRSASTTET